MSGQETKNKSKYKLLERERMTDNERELVSSFLEKYAANGTSQLELRLPSQEVRSFLAPYSITLTKFNRMTSCLGRTTGNRYAYSIPILLSLASPAYAKERKYHRRLQSDRIKTLNYYGSKRRWLREYTMLFQYIHDEYRCSRFIDCFAGSCALSLLASRLGCFSSIVANEGSPSVYNFHAVMKGDDTFEKFVRSIELTPHLNRDSYRLIDKDVRNGKNYDKGGRDIRAYEGREMHLQVQTISVSAALRLYLANHYAFQSQGGYSSTATPVSLSVDSLRDSHKLYAPIELTQLYYKKVLLRYMESGDALILLDPPYQKEMRVQKQSYGLEFSSRQHRTLIQLLSGKEHASKIILCGYKGEDNGRENSDLYSRYVLRSGAEWHCYRFLRVGSLQKSDEEGAKEHIWTNFSLETLVAAHPDLFEQVF